MFHHEQTAEVPLCTFLAGAESRGHCVAGGSEGPECAVSSSVPLPALCMAQQQATRLTESPAPLAMHARAIGPGMFLLPWGIGKVQSGSGERCTMTGDELQKLQFPLSVQQGC